MLIAGRPLWIAETNTYAVATGRGEQCVLVDAPPDIDGIKGLLGEYDLTPVALLTTHGHIDHAGGGDVVRGFNATAYLHPDDAFLALDPGAQLSMLFGQADPDMAAACGFPEYQPLSDGDRIELAGFAFDVVHTPGHTPGHCCFVVADQGVMFSGDQLFAGSIGRTDLPGGDFNALVSSMVDKVLTFPDETTVLPGHGPATTIGDERRTNPFIRSMLGNG